MSQRRDLDLGGGFDSDTLKRCSAIQCTVYCFFSFCNLSTTEICKEKLKFSFN